MGDIKRLLINRLQNKGIELSTIPCFIKGEMKCQKCGFENLDGMSFCGKCGAKLETVCPQCSFSNPAGY